MSERIPIGVGVSGKDKGMNHKITKEWLQSFGDDDYEPSGLMTPRDRAELERRKAERLRISLPYFFWSLCLNRFATTAAATFGLMGLIISAPSSANGQKGHSKPGSRSHHSISHHSLPVGAGRVSDGHHLTQSEIGAHDAGGLDGSKGLSGASNAASGSNVSSTGSVGTGTSVVAPLPAKILFDYPNNRLPSSWTGTGDFSQPKFSAVSKIITTEAIAGTDSPFIISTRSEGKKDNSETGSITSESFQIPSGYALTFKLAGGKDPWNLKVSLMDSAGKELRNTTGNNSYNFNSVTWQGSDLINKDLKISFSDKSVVSHGFIAGSEFKLVVVAPTALGTAPSIVNLDPDLQKRLNTLTNQYIANNNIPAGYACIVWDGQIVAYCAAGFADKEKNIRASVNDQLRLGSISKTITSILIGELVNSGVMTWNETIRNVFPDLANKYPDSRPLNATVWQLLCHHGGIRRHDVFDPKLNILKGSEWRRKFLELCLTDVGNPGPESTEEYGPGPTIAVAMAEKITGKDYETLMHDVLCKPLGLQSFAMGVGPKTPQGYWVDEKGIRPAPPANLYLCNDPSGGVCLSLEDAAKICLLRTEYKVPTLDGNPLNLSEQNISFMNTPPYGIEDRAALGLYYESREGQAWLSHGGNTGCGDWTLVRVSYADGGSTIIFYNFNINRPGGDPRPGFNYEDYNKQLGLLLSPNYQ